MTYYFIDFENVHETGLKGIETLPAEDRVHLFYTVNANKISWEFFEIFRGSNILLHKVAAGKQALDMMLSSFLGHTVATDPGARFVIISRDRDYDPVVDFWNMAEPPVAVSRFTTIAAACGVPAGAEEAEEQAEQPERRRATPNRSRKNGRFVRSADASAAKEKAEAEEAPAVPEPAVATETAPAEEPKPAEPAQEAAGAKAEPAKKPARRGGRSRSVRPKTAAPAEKPAEPVKAEKKPEETAAAESAEPAKAEKPAEPAKAEKKEKAPATARRNGAESNAVHNAVQKVLAQEKIDSATIAFLASLTAKNWGKENDKQLIYRAVIKQYGQKEGLRLYGIMKPCLKG